MAVVIETSLGDITVDLYTEERPKACFNFLKLCKTKYYNYCLITEIKKDYTVRTGDPSGEGGESIYTHAHGELGRLFEAEMEPRIKHTRRGSISMINNGTNKHGSQFFITLESNLDYLDQQGHTVFGVVTEGLDTLDIINKQIVDNDGVPYQDICISHTVVLADPYPDPPYLVELLQGLKSPDIPDRLLNSDRIGICESLDDDTEGKSAEQLREEMEKKEAESRAIVLEMIGDLPSAEVKPPENVLFVCKLNPITREEDLRVIFSRFGPITSCDVIKDAKTGQSLQYAFIEFEDRNHCEKAYFKMDNVLIDDCRIHVDFSQSVAKLKWQQYRQMRMAKRGASSAPQSFMRRNQMPVDRHENLIQNPRSSPGWRDESRPATGTHGHSEHRSRSREGSRAHKSSSSRSHREHRSKRDRDHDRHSSVCHRDSSDRHSGRRDRSRDHKQRRRSSRESSTDSRDRHRSHRHHSGSRASSGHHRHHDDRSRHHHHHRRR